MRPKFNPITNDHEAQLILLEQRTNEATALVIHNMQKAVELLVDTRNVDQLQALHNFAGALFKQAAETLDAGGYMGNYDEDTNDNSDN